MKLLIAFHLLQFPPLGGELSGIYLKCLLCYMLDCTDIVFAFLATNGVVEVCWGMELWLVEGQLNQDSHHDRVNEQRERTKLYTRRYLEEQLRTVLAGDLSAPAVCSAHINPTLSKALLKR